MAEQGTEGNIAGVALPYEMDGKEYWLQTLTDLDIMELDAWVQSRIIENAMIAARNPFFSEQERDKIYAVACRESIGVTWYSNAGARVISTTAGIARLLYQSLKGKYPEVTHLQVAKWLHNNADRAREAQRLFDRANSLPSDSPDMGATNPDAQQT